MSTRIAHFSDTHVLSLDGVGIGRFLNKRWTGAVNLALNRSRHYRTEIFVRVLDAIVDLDVDHVVCTGDLVNLALEPEFAMVRELLASRFGPDELTLVPGNHDAYVKEAVTSGLFERSFGEFLPADVDLGLGGARYPITRVLDEVFIVGINSAVPTPVFVASGEVDRPQLAGLRTALGHAEAAERFRLVLLHHPLLPEPKRRLDITRRLNNADAVIDTLRGAPARPHLVVHGHNHEYKAQTVPGTDVPLIQVASASKAGNHSRAEFNVYVVEDGALAAIERHIHQPETGRFLPHDDAGRPLTARAS